MMPQVKEISIAFNGTFITHSCNLYQGRDSKDTRLPSEAAGNNAINGQYSGVV